MGKNTTVEIDRTDLVTLLGCLASDLRNTGLAIRGAGHEHSSAGEPDFADADRLAGSLDRVASVLDGVRERLCKDCQLLAISEQIQVEDPRSRTPQ